MSTVKLGARSGVKTSENAVASRRGKWKFERDFDGNVDSHTLSLPHGKCVDIKVVTPLHWTAIAIHSWRSWR